MVPPLTYRPTVPGLIRHGVDSFADHEMVVDNNGARLTYYQAESASRSLARRLVAAGIGKGARVAAQLPYGAEWIVTWLAANRLGALFIPFSTAYKPAELRKALRHADAHLLVAPAVLFGRNHVAYLEEAVEGLASSPAGRLALTEAPFLRSVWIVGTPPTPLWAEPLSIGPDGLIEPTAGSEWVTDSLLDEMEAEVSPADLAIGIYTSGTTSEPKGVLHSHGALVRKGHALAWYQQWTGQDRVYCGMPFFWVGGVGMTVVPAMDVGATLLCVERTEAEPSLDLMEREQATRLTGWPGVVGPILSHPSRSERQIPALDRPRVAVAKPGEGAISSLGMTETLASHTLLAPTADPPIVSRDAEGICMGPPVEGFEHRIVDPDTGQDLPEGAEGALLVRGYGLMQAMIKREREETFTRDGWYNTGDKCYFRDGLLYLTGRLTEMIKTSGNNVAPPEVEAVLMSLPEVAEAHVLGVPDAERGEIVAALIVPSPGAQVDLDDVLDRIRPELSNYKVPRRVVIAEAAEVPMLATGKPDRLAIRALLAVE